MARKPMVICGGGIAGLTLAIRLREQGEDTIVLERAPGPPTSGYMIDFYGSGWDVAKRMGLTDRIRQIRYPIERLEYVDEAGTAVLDVPLEKVRNAFSDEYAYLRRQDLSNLLLERATALGVTIRFGVTIDSIGAHTESVEMRLSDGTSLDAEILFGADGIHSQVRRLIFGEESQYSNYLGYYVAAFELPSDDLHLSHAVKMHEAIDSVFGIYPLGRDRADTSYVFRCADLGQVTSERRLKILRERFGRSGWIAGKMLDRITDPTQMYFDSATQIKMDWWHRGRVVLLGDAAACLTLLAGQGSHMAMAAAYVLSCEIRKTPHDLPDAFQRYEDFLRPFIEKKQAAAERMAGSFVPSRNSKIWFRRLFMRVLFMKPFLKYAVGSMGAKSVLAGYR